MHNLLKNLISGVAILSIAIGFDLISTQQDHIFAQEYEFKVDRECIIKLLELNLINSSSPDQWISGLRFSNDTGKIAVSLVNKSGENDNILFKKIMIYPDGSNKEEITDEAYNEINAPVTPELHESVRTRFDAFVLEKFKPHTGMLGGTVTYHITHMAYSPNETKIAFLIEGDDGHARFYPSVYVSDILGYSITRIDSTAREMCSDATWISDDELVYSKDGFLWKATVTEP